MANQQSQPQPELDGLITKRQLALREAKAPPPIDVPAMTRLYDEATWSDVTVICGIKTMKLHRSVICTHSPFFYAACTSGMKESEGTIVINEKDMQVVEAVIFFMYVGSYDRFVPKEPKAGNKKPKHALCVRQGMFHVNVAVLADEWIMPNLVKYAADQYDQNLRGNPEDIFSLLIETEAIFGEAEILINIFLVASSRMFHDFENLTKHVGLRDLACDAPIMFDEFQKALMHRHDQARRIKDAVAKVRLLQCHKCKRKFLADTWAAADLKCCGKPPAFLTYATQFAQEPGTEERARMSQEVSSMGTSQ